MASPTSCFIDTAGIHVPDFNSLVAYLQSQALAIFGSDLYLGNDSQDGQLIGVLALALYDNNAMAAAVYNSFSPATALGVGLSTVVKINGLTRLLPTNSTVDVVLTGVAGTIIPSGVVSDVNQHRWNLPSNVVISSSGQTTVTVTADQPGAVESSPNTLTTIATPTLGWQSVTNPLAGNTGAPLETDALLRIRQSQSTMLPAISALESITGAVANIAGVQRIQPYENDTNLTDANTLPPHSIAIVVDGGDAQIIANTIALHKTPGCFTYGTTSETVIDSFGVPHTIRFYRPTVVPITVTVHLTPLNGYTSAVGAQIVAAIANYVVTQPIGQDVLLSKLTGAANLLPPITNTFNITSILLGRSGAAPAAHDVLIAFNEEGYADSTLITISIP